MTDWSEETPSFELLKQTVTLPEVAEMLGLEPNSQGKIVSPWNENERTPSCHLYEDHFYDFSVGRGGDVIDLVLAFYPEMRPKDALWKIWRRALRAGREPGDVERVPVRTVQDFTEQLLNYGPVYEARYKDLYPPANCRWGYDNELLIPHEDQEGVYGVKVRALDGTKSSWPGSQFTKRLYDPLGWVDPDIEGTAVVCEGESDCWALSALLPDSVAVLALPSGAGSWKDSWLNDLRLAEKVWLCMDNDEAGERARDKLTRRIGFLRVEQLRVPQLYNDARAAIAAGWKPALS